ncbi:MAG TPA: SDR family oxidoreductase [Deltaproteobacteria bacterium]|nr:SDR family oxidoreductase [Deltaproteobacteria bacterium]
MEKRLEGKVAIVTGAGQTPGDTIGNGRAISILFARAGAKVAAVDRNFESAQETQKIIIEEGGESFALQADVTRSDDCRKIAEECAKSYGRIDILVNNVGAGSEALGPVKLKEEDWERIYDANLKSIFLTCKHVIPYMEKQGSGSIVNISSIASVCASPMLAYKTSKSAVNSFTHAIAFMYARSGIRANTIMPGLMNTPMAIEGISRIRGIKKEDLIEERSRMIPLKGGMGTGWDTAYAALFLASDEAKFITGALLPVDGGQSARIG